MRQGTTCFLFDMISSAPNITIAYTLCGTVSINYLIFYLYIFYYFFYFFDAQTCWCVVSLHFSFMFLLNMTHLIMIIIISHSRITNTLSALDVKYRERWMEYSEYCEKMTPSCLKCQNTVRGPPPDLFSFFSLLQTAGHRWATDGGAQQDIPTKRIPLSLPRHSGLRTDSLIVTQLDWLTGDRCRVVG